MQLPELARLANALASTGQCRFMEPGGTQAAPFTHESRHPDGREIDEVFDRIEEPGSWIALYNVQTHPVYKAFLDEVAVGFRPLAEREQGTILKMDGFIFISAPPSVTPFHIDRENNFWLQIRGRKILNVWDRTDREVVRAADVDRFIVDGSLKNVRMKDGFLERSQMFDVGPGEDVYFPSTSPHSTRSDADWVRPGDGVSISIGLVFCTDLTRFVANVHACNLLLRRLGLSPRDAGKSTLADRAKYVGGRAMILGLRTLRGYRPKPGL